MLRDIPATTSSENLISWRDTPSLKALTKTVGATINIIEMDSAITNNNVCFIPTPIVVSVLRGSSPSLYYDKHSSI